MIGAVDIGGTKIAVALVEDTGRISARDEWPTSTLPPRSAVRKIAEWFAGRGKELETALHGVGIGCTGPVDPQTGIIGQVDLLPGWSGLHLTELLSNETGLTVAMENDADAAALAEAHWGCGKGASRFIYVTVSTGIGTGMVFDNRLYRGQGGFHPEAGHQTLNPSGPLCYCGAHGCWESLASGPAMVRWIEAEAGAGHSHRSLTAADVCDLARQGDSLAIQAVARESQYLGIGLANLITIFCPDTVALGGGVMRSADLFLEGIQEIVKERCGLIPMDCVTIKIAELGADAPLLGAARVWQTRYRELE